MLYQCAWLHRASGDGYRAYNNTGHRGPTQILLRTSAPLTVKSTGGKGYTEIIGATPILIGDITSVVEQQTIDARGQDEDNGTKRV